MWRGDVIGASAFGTIAAPCGLVPKAFGGSYPVEPAMIGIKQKKYVRQHRDISLPSSGSSFFAWGSFFTSGSFESGFTIYISGII